MEVYFDLIFLSLIISLKKPLNIYQDAFTMVLPTITATATANSVVAWFIGAIVIITLIFMD